MSILETFLVLFKADTTDLQKGTQEASNKTKKLNEELTVTGRVTEHLGGHFTGMIRAAGGMLVALAGAAAVIGGLKAAVHFADKLGELSDALNVNIEDLSAWGDAVKMSGGTAEGFQSTVKTLTASLADFATKGKSRVAPFFEELNIKMVDARGKARGVMEILPEIAQQFEKLSKAESFGIGQKMGLDEGTIMLLQRGRREVDAFIAKQKELGVVTKQDAEIAAKFNDSWDDMAHAFRSLFVQINSAMLPLFRATADAVKDLVVWLRQNPDVLKTVIVSLGLLFSALFPIAAVISAIGAAFVLVYDDIQHYRKGQLSLIGDIEQKYPTVFAILKGVFGFLSQVFKLTWQSISIVLSKLAEFPQHVATVANAFEALWGTVSEIWNSLVDLILSGVDKITGAIDTIVNAFKSVKSFLGFDGGELDANINATQQVLGLAGSSGIGAQTSNSITSSNRSVSKNSRVDIGTVNIQTQATDAEGIATSFNSNLSAQMKQALDTYDDGVLA